MMSGAANPPCEVIMKYQDVINSTPVVLVEFFATWCPHCQRMMPVVEQISELLAGQTDVYQFDIDQNREEADRLDVQSIPTFIIYKDGREVWRRSGELDGQDLLARLQSYQ